MGIQVPYPKDGERKRELDGELEGNLDIIAVHGLNGDYKRTWTQGRRKRLWLRDFLPLDLPRARVMVFGYDATPVLTSSTAGIEEHARDLVRCLLEKRGRPEEVKRPLVFIGYSLGGLVIKQALIIAQREHWYRRIYESTAGVLFFGTPHQGSSIASYSSTWASALCVVAIKPPPKLLQTLRLGSEELLQLMKDFTAHQEERQYEIVSFYETRTMKGSIVILRNRLERAILD